MAERPSQRPAGGETKLVVVALVIAAFAAIGNYIYIQSVEARAQRETFTVFVLNRNVEPGYRLRRDDVEAVRLPAQFHDEFDRLAAVIGEESLAAKLEGQEEVKVPAVEGEFLRHTLFLQPKDAAYFGVQPPDPGKREIVLPVNSQTAPSSLRAGMFVDIEAPFRTGPSIPEVLPVMERVRVKSVGRYTLGDQPETMGTYRTISIEVTPEEATDLAQIKLLKAGDFEVHLRGPDDTQQPKIEGGGINPRVLRLMREAGIEPHSTLGL